MRTAAQNVVQIAAITLQPRLGGIEALKRLVIDAHQLGRLEARGRTVLDVCAHDAALHRLILRHTCVFVAAALGIIHEVAQVDSSLLNELQIGQQLCGGLADLSVIARHLGSQLLEFRKIRLIGLVGRIEILQRPLIGLAKLGSFRNFFYFAHSVTLQCVYFSVSISL